MNKTILRAVVLALLTALGGVILRDVIAGVPANVAINLLEWGLSVIGLASFLILVKRFLFGA